MTKQEATIQKHKDIHDEAVGEWVHRSWKITREDGGNLLLVSALDGGPIPKELEGRWTSLMQLKSKIDFIEEQAAKAANKPELL